MYIKENHLKNCTKIQKLCNIIDDYKHIKTNYL